MTYKVLRSEHVTVGAAIGNIATLISKMTPAAFNSAAQYVEIQNIGATDIYIRALMTAADITACDAVTKMGIIPPGTILPLNLEKDSLDRLYICGVGATLALVTQYGHS